MIKNWTFNSDTTTWNPDIEAMISEAYRKMMDIEEEAAMIGIIHALRDKGWTVERDDS